MLVAMYAFEFAWKNPLLLNAWLFIPVSILLVQIWGFLTFIPFWIVNKSIRENIKFAIFYCFWPVLGLAIALLK